MEQEETISIDRVIDSMKIGRPQVLLSLIFIALHGLEVADINSAILLGAVLQCTWNISRFQASLLVTISYMGMLPGGVILGMLGDRFGRRDLLLIANTTAFFLLFLIAISPTINWVIFLRSVLGFFIGGSYGLSTSLLIELLPQHCRSKSVVSMFLGTSVGLLYGNLVFLAYPVLGWRWVIFIISLPIFFVTLMLFCVPRSPLFLLLANRYAEAIAVLRFLAGRDANCVTDQKTVVAARSEDRGKVMDVFKGRYLLTTILMIVVLFGVAFCQIGTMTAVVYLPASLAYRCPGGTSLAAETSDNSCCPVTGLTTFANAAWTSIGPVVFTIGNCFVIDWIGRKKSKMLWAAIAVLTILFLNLCQPLATVRLLMALTTGANEALFACAFLYIGEYYPTSVRASAYGVCCSCSRIGYILGVYPAQMLLSSIGTPLVLAIYATVMCSVFVSVFLLPVETMGKRLTQTTDEETDSVLKTPGFGKYDTFSSKAE